MFSIRDMRIRESGANDTHHVLLLANRAGARSNRAVTLTEDYSLFIANQLKSLPETPVIKPRRWFKRR